MRSFSRCGCFIAFASLGTASSLGCSKPTSGSAGASSAASLPSSSALVAADEPSSGLGTLEGTVAFVGQVPIPLEIARSADPSCAGKSMKAGDVVVGPGGAFKDVLVRIAPGAVKGRFVPPAEPVHLKQQDCAYVPRVQGAALGQLVRIENVDRTAHDIHAYRGQETVLNHALPAGAPPLDTGEVTVRPGIFKFKCDAHPWMTGFLVVTDHPFFQTTGDAGTFQLTGVPAGRYTVEAWHPRYGLKTAAVAVTRDQVAHLSFVYDGAEKGD